MLNVCEEECTVSDNERDVFSKIERNSNISTNEIYRIAHALQYEDLTDEHTVRNLVRELASLANRPISHSKEDEIVAAIIHNQIPNSMEALQRLFD